MEDHIKHVDEILPCLSETNVTSKIKKCRFFTSTVEFLGHVINTGEQEIDHKNMEFLRKEKRPTSKTESWSFLQICRVYCWFTPSFKNNTANLNELLKKNNLDSFILNEEQITSLKSLIETVCTPKILASTKINIPFSADTNASNYQVGYALFRTHLPGERKPIGYWSRSLNQAEKGDSETERDRLEFVWVLKILRPNLLSEKFDVNTDHAILGWLLTLTNSSGRLMQWKLRLAEFYF